MNTAAPNHEPQWRSLADRDRQQAGGDEFMPGAPEWNENFNRRDFLQRLSASLALGGLAGCVRQPREEIVPYVRQPEEVLPGEPLWFATAMELGGRVNGLLVKSHEGRPTKIEGNPDHPETIGRSSVLMQAALLDLYDPDRSKTVLRNGQPATWNDFLGELMPHRMEWRTNQAAGLCLLTGSTTSPTLLGQITELLKKHPGARWHVHDAASPPVQSNTVYHFDQADVVVSLGADFLGGPAASPREIHAFSRRRGDQGAMNRLYALESMPSLTGAMGDHRRAVRPREMESLATALSQGNGGDPWIAAMRRDLERHKGRSLVIAGEFESPAIHAAARALNEAFGNVGHTVEYLAPVPSPAASSLADLVAAMAKGEVKTLVMCGVNPVFTAAPDLDFAAALRKVPLTIHHGLHADETATLCQWHLPQSHFLESWSDLQAWDGTLSIVQPLIEPLYATNSAHDLLAALIEDATRTAYDIVRESWRARLTGDFEAQWRKALHDGISPGPRPAVAPPLPPGQSKPAAAGSLELLIRPDPHLLDGRFSSNTWLQELPRPLTKLCWENAAHLSPATARRLGIAHGEVVELRCRGRSVSAPAWVLPGHADECVTVHLGHGRSKQAGFNAQALQFADAPWGGPGLEVRGTKTMHEFATTQEHQSMEGRDLVRVETAASRPSPEARLEESLYPPVKYAGHAWGMAIDLSACIGCSVCTIACQAENNIPVVGREQVMRGREMQWIRVDRYFAGTPESPQILHQPVPCMHCENAPCEVVCPVAATVHDHEGLNQMVYNRCVGTRYCSNNCPYKVRRFNFLQYSDERKPQLKLQRNPDVSVRMRGVMEKCTYCVQRISRAHITADKENRTIRDGEIVTACMQACPAEAIVFGDLNDPASKVSRMKASARNYTLLGELNTRPRTSYLARRTNPNPEIG